MDLGYAIGYVGAVKSGPRVCHQPGRIGMLAIMWERGKVDLWYAIGSVGASEKVDLGYAIDYLASTLYVHKL